MHSIDINGIILAGGQDKGLTMLANHPLIAHVISALSPQVASISISANQNISDYQSFGYEVFEDSISGFTDTRAGPLAGLLTAMKRAGSEAVVVVPCDAPLLPKDLVSRLVEAVGDSKPLAVIPHDGTRLQPLFGLYSLKALGSLEAFLNSGQRKVGIWVESLSPQVVDFSDQPDAFLNINSPEELVEAESRI